MSVINFIIGLAFSAPLLAMASPSNCGELLLTRSAEVEVIRDQMRDDVKNPELTIQELRISAQNLVFKDVLGYGVHGSTYLVERDGQAYALKLFRHRYNVDLNEAVIIQKVLGDLEIAPKVYGFLDEYEARSFLGRYDKLIPYHYRNGVFAGGILMELTSSKFLKETTYSLSKVQITPGQRVGLRAQAREYLALLKELDILAHDIDAVVDADGRLLLVDLGYYELLDHNDSDPEAWMYRVNDPRVVFYYINFGTSTFKARWERFKTFLSSRRSLGSPPAR